MGSGSLHLLVKYMLKFAFCQNLYNHYKLIFFWQVLQS